MSGSDLPSVRPAVTVHYSTVQYIMAALQYSTVQYNAVQMQVQVIPGDPGPGDHLDSR